MDLLSGTGVATALREAIMREKCSFFNMVQKAFGPPPHLFEHYVVNFVKEF